MSFEWSPPRAALPLLGLGLLALEDLLSRLAGSLRALAVTPEALAQHRESLHKSRAQIGPPIAPPRRSAPGGPSPVSGTGGGPPVNQGKGE